MSADVVYSASQAAKAAGISHGSLRNYCQGGRFGSLYGPYFSAGAAPPPGQPRLFTAGDVALLRFIRSKTAQGVSHEAIAAELAAMREAGEDAPDGTAGMVEGWQPPEESAAQVREARRVAADGQEEAAQQTAALVAVQAVADRLASVMTAQLEQAQAVNAGLAAQVLDAEKRAAAADREAELLRAQLQELRAELGQLRNRGVVARLLNRG
jgi:DNA-binding transcriptional MerR regulator